MGKTFKRNSKFQPKQHGKVFVKNYDKKKHKSHFHDNNESSEPPDLNPDKFND